MANTYVIGKTTFPSNQGGDPIVTIEGSVNGVPLAVQCWLSVYTAHAASVISTQNFIISLLLAAYNALAVAVPTNAPPVGTTIVQ